MNAHSHMRSRIQALEQQRGRTLIVVTYSGKPEPDYLDVGGVRVHRDEGEAWGDFTARVGKNHPHALTAIGPM